MLIGRPGMTGMTLNVYCGLAETDEMGFALHLLRDDSLFVDVGANVGVYTVLASGVCGATTIACEPIEKARSDLRRNVAVNGIGARVEIHQCAVGAEVGTVLMIDGAGALTNLPNPARWFPVREMRPRPGNQGVQSRSCVSPPRSNRRRVFQC